MARPSSYRTEYADQAEKLCKLGATDKQIADFFGVSEQTVNNWKQAHPEFLESLRSGKELADANVASSLYQRAMGYSHEAVKIAASPTGEHVAVPYVERYPPDTTAAIFWLKNRRPDLWRDRHTQEISGPNGGPIETVSKIERVIARPNASDSDG
jgi:transcriptional regulator with XRE-family HTH domain